MVTADEVVSGAAAVVVVVVMANHSVLPRLFSVSFVNHSTRDHGAPGKWARRRRRTGVRDVVDLSGQQAPPKAT